MKIAKVLLLIVVSFVIILIIGLLFTQTTMFKNYLKNRIIVEVNKNINGELFVDDIDGNLFSNLEISNIKLSNQEEALLTLRKLELSYSIWGILSHKLIIKSIIFDSMTVKLDQDDNKNWDIVGLIKPKETSTEKPPEMNWHIIIDDLVINDFSADIHQNLKDKFIPEKIKNLYAQLQLEFFNKELIWKLKKLNFQTENPNFSLKNLTLNNRISEDIQIDSLKLVLPESNLYLNGKIDLTRKKLSEINVKLEPLDFDDIRNFIPDFPIYGNPVIDIYALSISDTIVFEMKLIQDKQVLILNGNLLNFEEDPIYQIYGDITEFDPATWLNDISIQSNVNSSFELSGSGKDLFKGKQELALQLYPSVIIKRRLRNLNLRLVNDAGFLHAKLNTSNSFGAVDMSGTYKFLDKKQDFDFQGKISNFNLAPILEKDNIVTDINLDFQAKGKGRELEDINANIILNLLPSMINDIQIDSLYSKFNYDKGDYRIDSLQFITDLAKLSLKGIGNLKENNIDFNISIRDPQSIQSLLKADKFNLVGLINGNISGSLDSLQTMINLDLKDIDFNDISVENINGKINLFKQAKSFSGDSDIKFIKSKVSNIAFNTLNVKSDFENNIFNSELDLVQSDSLKAVVSLNISQDSLLSIKIPQIDIELGNRDWQGGSDSLLISIDKNNYNFNNIELSSDQQRISIHGQFDKMKEHNINANVMNLDISQIPDFLIPLNNPAGIVNLSLTSKGSLEEPFIKCNILLDNFSTNELSVQRLDFKCNLDKDLIDANLDCQINKDERIFGNAILPVELRNNKKVISRNEPIQVTLNSNIIDISKFRLIYPNIKTLAGLLSLELELSNTINSPQIGAKLMLKDAKIEIPGYGINYNDLQLQIVVDNDQIKLIPFSMKSKKGSLICKGTMLYDHKNISEGIKSMDISLKAKQFSAMKNKDLEANINADILLKGNFVKPEFQGNLEILRSKVFIPAFQKNVSSDVDALKPLLVQALDEEPQNQKQNVIKKRNKSKFIDNLRGRLTVKIPKNTWIRSNDMNIELKGDLKIVKDNEYFEIFGAIETVRGNYTFYGKRFDIQKGIIDFSGGKELNLEFNIEAQYTFRNISGVKKELKTLLSGNVMNPSINFYLDDLRIEEIDAISYLLFGKNSSDLTYGEKSQMGQSKSEDIAKLFLVKQLTNQLVNTLQNKMNLDVIEFKGDSNWRQASIVIGKYITNKLFLSYKRDFAINQSSEIVPEQIFLEYELNKSFFLQSTKGSRHNTGFDLFWKFEK